MMIINTSMFIMIVIIILLYVSSVPLGTVGDAQDAWT